MPARSKAAPQRAAPGSIAPTTGAGRCRHQHVRRPCQATTPRAWPQTATGRTESALSVRSAHPMQHATARSAVQSSGPSHHGGRPRKRRGLHKGRTSCAGTNKPITSRAAARHHVSLGQRRVAVMPASRQRRSNARLVYWQPVRMMNEPETWSAVPQRHLERVEYELGPEMSGHAPADYTATPAIDDGQIDTRTPAMWAHA